MVRRNIVVDQNDLLDFVEQLRKESIPKDLLFHPVVKKIISTTLRKPRIVKVIQTQRSNIQTTQVKQDVQKQTSKEEMKKLIDTLKQIKL